MPLQDLSQIESAETLEELSEVMDCDSIDEAYKQAKESYPSLIQDQLNDWYGRFDNDEFPYMPAESNGMEIQVHGFNHGISDVDGALRYMVRLGTGTDLKDYELGDEVKNFVQDNVEKFLDNEEPVYAEQRFAENILAPFEDHDLFEEIDDVGYGNTAAFRDITSLKARNYSELPTLYDGIKAKVFGNYKAEKEKKEIEETLSDPSTTREQQKKIHEEFLPVRFEEEWTKENSLPEYYRTHLRSKRMAEYTIKDMETEKAHIVCGTGHQPGLVDYINNLEINEDEELTEFHENEDALKHSEFHDTITWPTAYTMSQSSAGFLGLMGVLVLSSGIALNEPEIMFEGGAYLASSGALNQYSGDAIDRFNELSVSMRS